MYIKKSFQESEANINEQRLTVDGLGDDFPNITEVALAMEEDLATTEDADKKTGQVSRGISSLNKWLKYYWHPIIDLVSLTGAIAAVILFLNQGISATELGILGFMIVFTGIGGEVGLHRLFAHKSYEVVKPIRILLAIAGSMIGEAPVIEYAAFHRRHHLFSDRVGDPHSPHYFDGKGPFALIKNVWHTFLGWKYNAEINDLARPDKFAKELLAEPELVLINQSFYWLVLASFALPALLGLALTRTWQGTWTSFLWGGPFRLFMVTVMDDGFIRAGCHLIGTRPFVDQPKSLSTNIWILAIPSLGTSFHNNHHAFPGSAVTGIDWWQLDLSGLLITVLEKTGLAWNVKRPTAKQIKAKRATSAID